MHPEPYHQSRGQAHAIYPPCLWRRSPGIQASTALQRTAGLYWWYEVPGAGTIREIVGDWGDLQG